MISEWFTQVFRNGFLGFELGYSYVVNDDKRTGLWAVVCCIIDGNAA
jgi:hypothetical protein